MARREFTRDVYAKIVKRAMTPSGEIACEGCGLMLGKKPYHVDHTKPDGLEVDKTRKLTPDDGKLLGVECCHNPKTKQDVAQIAAAKRREAKFLGIKTAKKKPLKSQGFPPSEHSIKRQPKTCVVNRPSLYEAKP